MRLPALVLRRAALLPLVPPALASPARRAEAAPLLLAADALPGRYMVKLKDGGAAAALDDAMRLFPAAADHVFRHVLTGFAAGLAALRHHPAVDYVEQDGMASAGAYVDQGNPPWGLARISHRRRVPRPYVYDDSAGAGACAYVVDSGIDNGHPDFQGRARQLTSFVHGQALDNNGHGTHVAGIIGSASFGVAKEARLYGIKVLDAAGRAPWSTIIAGIDHVAVDAPRRRCPSGVVVNLSISGNLTQLANAAAAAALAARGFFVAVAAGNDADDAVRHSPASEPSVCTVGGTGSDDAWYPASNFGPLVDVLAPAVEVLSTLPGGRLGLGTGTSMAAPHVAGLAAYLAARDGIVVSPALCLRMQRNATPSAIRNLPLGTVNLLAFNGNSGGARSWGTRG